jgi:hypothetical protein
MFSDKIPPVVPKVFIDTALHIAPEETNFDFRVFYDLSREVGLKPKDIEGFTQIYTAEMYAGANGKYDEVRQLSRVSVSSCIYFSDVIIPKKIAEHGSLSARYGVDVFKNTSVAGVINEATVHEFGHHVETSLARADASGWAQNTKLGREIAAMTKMSVLQLGNCACRLLQKPLASFPTECEAFRFQEQFGNTPIVSFAPTQLNYFT